MEVRINKFIAQNAVYSRRKADELIKTGVVSLNNKRATLGDVVDTAVDTVSIAGSVITSPKHKKFKYVLFHKPINVLSTTSDDRGRKTVIDLLGSEKRLYPVGRLDYLSSGLMLLTNDGDLAYKMTHPKYHVPKTYLVRVNERIDGEQLGKLRKGGIQLDDKRTSKTDIKRINDHLFEMTLYEGLKRQIRMSCRSVGLHVAGLKRLSIGELELGNLGDGETRELKKKEFIYINHIKSL